MVCLCLTRTSFKHMLLCVYFFEGARLERVDKRLSMCERRKKKCLPWWEIVNFCKMRQECLPEIDCWASRLRVAAYFVSVWMCAVCFINVVKPSSQSSAGNCWFGSVGGKKGDCCRGKLCAYLRLCHSAEKKQRRNGRRENDIRSVNDAVNQSNK